MNKEKAVSASLWVWVAAAVAAYLYQFRHFAGPIAELLGLS